MPDRPAIEPFTPADLAGPTGRALLRLNDAHATELSPLSADALATLLARAWWAGRIGADAFLLAFDHASEYDGGNFRWIGRRFDRFVYVDRLAVDPAARRRGAARALYAALATRAEAAGHTRLTCEVNLEPPNPASLHLHASLGFHPVGEGPAGPGKWVRYLEKPL